MPVHNRVIRHGSSHEVMEGNQRDLIHSELSFWICQECRRWTYQTASLIGRQAPGGRAAAYCSPRPGTDSPRKSEARWGFPPHLLNRLASRTCSIRYLILIHRKNKTAGASAPRALRSGDLEPEGIELAAR